MTAAEHETGPMGMITDPDNEVLVVIDSRPRLATVAIGTTLLATDQVRVGIRSVRGRTASVAVSLFESAKIRADQARERVRAAVDEADQRGRHTVAGHRQNTTSLVDTTIGGALGWAQIHVIPQIVDNLVPHLISDVMPRIIDGALPEIKSRVIPALIDDLSNDPQVRELIMAQSRGVLGQVTEQIRTGTTRADDRFEVAAHRIFGRGDKTANMGKEPSGTPGA